MSEQADLTNSRSDEVASPCRNVCQIDPHSGYCIGCLRTIDEISDWLEMSNEEKRDLLRELEARSKAGA